MRDDPREPRVATPGVPACRTARAFAAGGSALCRDRTYGAVVDGEDGSGPGALFGVRTFAAQPLSGA